MPSVMLDTSADPICQTCGYNLRGLVSDRCPECGEHYDRNRAREANIPWLRRSAMGNWRAYWQTVAAALFRPRKMAQELWNAPRTSPREATRFRLLLITQALITIMIAGAVLCWGNAHAGWMKQIQWLAAVETVCLVAPGIFLLLATELVQQDLWQRSMQYYACAPLALLPFVAALTIAVAVTHGPFESVAVLSLALILGWWWLNEVLFISVANKSSGVLHAFLLPFAWTGIAIVAAMFGSAAAGLMMTLMSRFN